MTTRCSMYSGNDIERGEYVIDGRADFGGQLAEQATNESDPLRSFVAGVRFSGLLDADWVHTRDVHVRPLKAQLERGDGTRIISAISQRYYSPWRERDLRAFAAECARHVAEPISARLPPLLEELGISDEVVSIGEARRREGSLADQVEISIGGRPHTVALVGDCWVRLTSSVSE